MTFDNRTLMERASRLLYGERMVAHLARSLGWTPRHMLRVVKGERPIPDHAIDSLVTLLSARVETLASFKTEIAGWDSIDFTRLRHVAETLYADEPDPENLFSMRTTFAKDLNVHKMTLAHYVFGRASVPPDMLKQCRSLIRTRLTECRLFLRELSSCHIS